MNVFAHFFSHESSQPIPDLLPVIERAINGVEPLLKQTSGYPDDYRAPIQSALEYARALAARLPGPVEINRESYAGDPLVHALFPSIESVTDALSSSLALQNHLREFPADGEVYALMGMRRIEKAVVGMRLTGQMVQHDVMQNMVYFTSHTIESTATSEAQARELVAINFFDRLTGKVAQRIAQRKQEKQALLQEKDILMAQLRAADEHARPALQEQLAHLMSDLQNAIGALELDRYQEDFVAILLEPAQHLSLIQTPIKLDSMGIRRDNTDENHGKTIIFDDLIGYDRRNWTVTMVHCSDLQYEEFSSRLERAYRTLSV
ncbi:MAG: hypothetical protein A2061_05400 [Gallionellales bacterium GWA2_59_43]|nr:MAG: hypothetical protein A2061_05400 [Gallionellales bacterium GWA2_59_43]